ncbi:MAG TPA: glycosyltransferase family 4 protein [Verrucomicrobiae bacterium]|nr:glycosyltransferase family 4 protein [Verrucomicrobiae bacterium]
MRFLMLNWRDPLNPISGGAERVSLAYLRGLVQRGHEVYWFTCDFPGGRRDDIVERIKIVRGGGKGSAVIKAIQWYRHQPRFDLVIDQHHGIPWYAPWWSQTRCVAYIHEVLGPIWNAFYPWPISTMGRWQECWTHWGYRNVPFWTPSECTRRILEHHGVREIHVFPNGVDTQPLTLLEPKPLQSPLRLMTVSRLAPNKRIDHVIRAVDMLRRQRDVHLVIAGTGEVETQLKQLVEKRGLDAHVEFTGLIGEAEKNQRLQQAHFLIHTSLREGWGLNVIEANAMGTPAVVYPVGGLVSSTVHDETGLVTDQETPESVVDAISAIMRTPEKYERLRLNAWNRAKTLQWDKVTPMVCDWLEAQAVRPR